MLPTTYSSFMQWAQLTAKTLGAQSNGSVRVGANKLAAAMASSLPGVSADFNINTLKARLDDASSPQIAENVTFDGFVHDLISDFLEKFHVELSQKWVERSQPTWSYESLFDAVDSECDLAFFWSSLEDLDDNMLCVVQSGWFTLPEEDRKAYTADAYNELKEQPGFQKKSFEYLTSHVTGVAFRSYMIQQLADTLHTIEDDAKIQCVPAQADAFYLFVDGIISNRARAA